MYGRLTGLPSLMSTSPIGGSELGLLQTPLQTGSAGGSDRSKGEEEKKRDILISCIRWGPAVALFIWQVTG